MAEMTPAKRSTNAAVNAAADNDLYRVCGTSPDQWRTRDNQWIYHVHVDYAIARGLLGDFAAPELIDGVWVQRLDLSEQGLDWYLEQTTNA